MHGVAPSGCSSYSTSSPGKIKTFGRRKDRQAEVRRPDLRRRQPGVARLPAWTSRSSSRAAEGAPIKPGFPRTVAELHDGELLLLRLPGGVPGGEGDPV